MLTEKGKAMNRRIEFIESYRKVGNDYQWSDNHGELVRCKECKHYRDCDLEHPDCGWCRRLICGTVAPDFYCADGEREEDE